MKKQAKGIIALSAVLAAMLGGGYAYMKLAPEEGKGNGDNTSTTMELLATLARGQGTVLASRLIADAAMKKGIQVCSAETSGMAQRGGSVFTNLRLGDSAQTPRIGLKKADLMIAFEPAEAVRMLPFLKEGGSAVVSSEPIMPVSAMVMACL